MNESLVSCGVEGELLCKGKWEGGAPFSENTYEN